MSGTSEARDEHYWDVVAQRQFDNVVEWLQCFVDPEFRERVWQKGTDVGQFYEESAAQFLDDVPIGWLTQEGLARLGAPPTMIDALSGFAIRYRALDESLPNWVDAGQLELNPGFIQIVEEAKSLLTCLEQGRSHMRRVEDDIPPYPA